MIVNLGVDFLGILGDMLTWFNSLGNLTLAFIRLYFNILNPFFYEFILILNDIIFITFNNQ